jgi:hypothetical protein
MKTSKLTGAALDWAVAKCEGLLCFGYRTDGWRFAIEDSDGEVHVFMPTTRWANGGPIIEREKLSVVMQQGMPPIWSANCPRALFRSQGPTPLIAAMRCFVASRLGDEVDVSSELLEV